jgi:hypothetical protein
VCGTEDEAIHKNGPEKTSNPKFMMKRQLFFMCVAGFSLFFSAVLCVSGKYIKVEKGREERKKMFPHVWRAKIGE